MVGTDPCSGQEWPERERLLPGTGRQSKFVLSLAEAVAAEIGAWLRFPADPNTKPGTRERDERPAAAGGILTGWAKASIPGFTGGKVPARSEQVLQ